MHISGSWRNSQSLGPDDPKLKNVILFLDFWLENSQLIRGLVIGLPAAKHIETLKLNELSSFSPIDVLSNLREFQVTDPNSCI